MRKLEDIPKRSVFKVPDGYFDQLPTKIQSRMNERQPSHGSTWSFSLLKYALPAIVLIAAGIFWLRPAPSMQDQFDQIDTEQLVLYLENTERIDSEEIDLDDLTETELDQLEDAIYSNLEFSDNIDLDDL